MMCVFGQDKEDGYAEEKTDAGGDAKFRQVNFFVLQGKSVADAVRSIGAIEDYRWRKGRRTMFGGASVSSAAQWKFLLTTSDFSSY
jgi:hypothetical protein